MVVRQTGPVSYEVLERDSDTVHRRHGDHVPALLLSLMIQNHRQDRMAAVLRTLWTVTCQRQSLSSLNLWL
ncbi:hypothetical protein NQZ68_013150 [Dissostichus eleginoides]|nr:hypothetical protein NQZ68_013150 [Dissostichus eleginoides]